MNNQLVQVNQQVSEVSNVMSILQLKERVGLVKQVLNEVMQRNEHYGVVPGCGDKPTLLKPGSEKLCTLFRLAPSYEIFEKELGDEHREYRVTTKLTHINTGQVWGEGLGIASTKEKKFSKRKNGSIEDPNDMLNTVLKMAKKRSLVDATLTTTGASDIFTQDVEDMEAESAPPRKPAQVHPAPRKPVQAHVAETAQKTAAPRPSPVTMNDSLSPAQEKWFAEKIEAMKTIADPKARQEVFEKMRDALESIKHTITPDAYDATLQRIADEYLGDINQ